MRRYPLFTPIREIRGNNDNVCNERLTAVRLSHYGRILMRHTSMPTFFQRPVTWLFWIAAACLDAVALSIDYESPLTTSLALGQLFVASGWLVVGRSRLLVRTVLFVGAIGLLSTPDFLVPRLRAQQFYVDLVWPHVLGSLIIAGAFVSLATGGWLALLRAASSGDCRQEPSMPRFSLATILGWMVVVAVVSTGLRLADFSLIDDDLQALLAVGGMAATAGAMTTAALGDYGAGWLPRALGFMGVATGMATTFVLMRVPNSEAVVVAGAWAFVAVWVLSMRLDQHRNRIGSRVVQTPKGQARLAPAIRLFADQA